MGLIDDRGILGDAPVFFCSRESSAACVVYVHLYDCISK